jgi:peptidyl-prolyl cis-trans isomerase B (cyclophilin B)
MKRIVYLLITITALVHITCLEAAEPVKEEAAEPVKEEITEPVKEVTSAVLETDMGKIVITFYREDAPKTVENFTKLVNEGFYDGTYFHRVIPGFMIQGGDPNTKDSDRSNDGMGNPGYTVDAEFNKQKHVRGTASMARSRHPNSAGSQFFICVAKTDHLNYKYTVFGKVDEGMDVVDMIVNAKRDKRDNPLKAIYIQKAYLK